MSFIIKLILLMSFVHMQYFLQIQPRIFGGWEDYENKFPYQVSLRSNGFHICGGSIIAPTYILTAAHCVTDQNGTRLPENQFFITAGSSTLFYPRAVRQVKNIVIHPEYKSFRNDLAILELSSPLQYSEYIQPIELNTEENPEYSLITISGWGREYSDGPSVYQLKYNQLRSLSSRNCKLRTGWNFEGHICLLHAAMNGACQGDSGGPAVYQNRLVGVANFVFNGCGTTAPDVYAKVSYYAKWIKEQANI